MPLSRIEVRKKRPEEEVQFLLTSLYEAQIEALKVPSTDRQIRYMEHLPEHFHIPPGRSENFTLVVIQLFPGRTVDAKRALYKSIVARFGKIGIAPSDIFIGMEESPRENWSMSDGVAACDL